MANFKADILAAAQPEKIIGIVIGSHGWSLDEFDDEDEDPKVPKYQTGVVLSWEDAAPLLDYEYSTGYGGPECHAVTVWTADKVFFVSQYDGATRVCSVPRNPTPHKPDMPGG